MTLKDHLRLSKHFTSAVSQPFYLFPRQWNPLETSAAMEFPGQHLKTQVSRLLSSFRFCRSEIGPETLHFKQVLI
jgi:hypothetical protein